MSTTRQSFIEIVTDDFKNSAIKERCIKESTEKILKGEADRAFDSFPHLTTDEEVTTLRKEFLKRLTFIKPNPQYILSDTEQSTISMLERSIVRKACHQLLDVQGEIKPDLINLLEWNDLKNKLDASILVYAFVSAIHQQLTASLSKLGMIEKHGEAYKSLYHFANPNFTKWIVEEMKKANYHYDNAYYESVERLNLRKILYLPIEKPGATIGVLAGVAALAATGTLLFNLVKCMSQPQSAEKPDTSPHFNGPKK